MANIYVSYRTTDKVLANEISSRLRELGHQIAIDTQELYGGQEWRTVLREALENSDCVLSLITVNSQSSQFALTEIGAARALHKPLIPIVVGEVAIPNVVADLYCIQHSGENLDSVIQEVDRAIAKLANRNVFIVHGHDEARKYELKNFLGQLGLNAIILHEQDSLGKTIIEKFEYYASRSNFAFVLMTPDDPSSHSDSTESKWRARQNVIMELGWFMAKLGRQRVVILHKGELEIPSDILGVVYQRFSENILEAGESIRQSLKGAGLIK
jgi:predicted nucleotide-binding protein